MKEPLISIILPIFNNSKTILTCINSVLAQNYKNFELICVDDCSTDNSSALLAAATARDKRIRVLSTSQNSGSAAARNLALEQAAGEFICFIDGDDTYAADYLGRMLAGILSAQADIVVCGCVTVLANGKQHYTHLDRRFASKVLRSNALAVRDILFSIRPELWIRMYKREKFPDMRFKPEFRQGEDMPFTAELFLRSSSIVFIDEGLYKYHVSQHSTCHAVSEKHASCVKRYINLLDLFKKYRGQDYYKKEFYNYISRDFIYNYYLTPAAMRKQLIRELADFLRCSEIKISKGSAVYNALLLLSYKAMLGGRNPLRRKLKNMYLTSKSKLEIAALLSNS